jgi:uncharacterized protein YndB with AHSA1/START domain
MKTLEGRTVTREEEFEASADEVWRALTDENILQQWLAEEVELDPREGGSVRVRDDGEERHGRVEDVDEGRRLAFTWARDGELPTLVEFELVPAVAGTRLIVTETAPHGVPIALTGAAWPLTSFALRGALAPATVPQTVL